MFYFYIYLYLLCCRAGETVLYAVHPKFRNVDIKITIDVTEGTAVVGVYVNIMSTTFLNNYIFIYRFPFTTIRFYKYIYSYNFCY